MQRNNVHQKKKKKKKKSNIPSKILLQTVLNRSYSNVSVIFFYDTGLFF